MRIDGILSLFNHAVHGATVQDVCRNTLTTFIGFPTIDVLLSQPLGFRHQSLKVAHHLRGCKQVTKQRKKKAKKAAAAKAAAAGGETVEEGAVEVPKKKKRLGLLRWKCFRSHPGSEGGQSSTSKVMVHGRSHGLYATKCGKVMAHVDALPSAGAL